MAHGCCMRQWSHYVVDVILQLLGLHAYYGQGSPLWEKPLMKTRFVTLCSFSHDLDKRSYLNLKMTCFFHITSLLHEIIKIFLMTIMILKLTGIVFIQTVLSSKPTIYAKDKPYAEDKLFPLCKPMN